MVWRLYVQVRESDFSSFCTTLSISPFCSVSRGTYILNVLVSLTIDRGCTSYVFRLLYDATISSRLVVISPVVNPVNMRVVNHHFIRT